MKRSERHHLKQNALAAKIVSSQILLERWRREITILGALAILLIVGSGIYVGYQRSEQAKGTDLLAEALTTATAPVISLPPLPDPSDPNSIPPAPAFQPGSFTSQDRRAEAALVKFMLTAETYPDSPAGITASYHAASILADFGRRDEAELQYQRVVDAAGEGIYGRMARLGLAETKMYSGKIEAAIILFEEEASSTDSQLPLDGLLMQLGRAYLLANRSMQAKESFARIVDEFPESSYGFVAQAELDRFENSEGG
ncbi:MAG TPA: hypothetical protein EYM91_06695 [Acidobacteria bacterium]|jgi:hypothetical protein|nr:hypothetical protein [Acidobacteriota bacterium]